MIIYGSRMYFKGNVVKTIGECEHCGAYGKLTSYQARQFGHLYFIPIIPMGAKSQVIRECSHCQMGTQISLTDLEPVADSLADQFKTWILAIEDGERELVPAEGTEPVNVGVLIAGILEDLYCLKEIEGVDSISSILTTNNLGYENEMVMGRWWEMQGDLDQARMSFRAANRTQPEDSISLYQLGSIETKLGNVEGAEEFFEKYAKLCPDDISPYIELVGLYEGNKDFAKIVQAYDMIYALSPETIPDKGMKKVYKKACKKSGVQGKFLNQM